MDDGIHEFFLPVQTEKHPLKSSTYLWYEPIVANLRKKPFPHEDAKLTKEKQTPFSLSNSLSHFLCGFVALCDEKTNKSSFHWLLIFGVILALLSSPSASAAKRVLPPEFDTNYKIPSPEKPYVDAGYLEYLDILALMAALSLSAFFAVKSRSRSNIFYLAVCSLIYFGFYRNGCICSVGAVQNLFLSLVKSDYVVPVKVSIFFFLPLLFSLFFGRVFCASVCPLGAIQELFIYAPTAIPQGGLSVILSLFPFAFLGLAVLFSATESAFIICKYDIFVGFFRLSGPIWIVLSGSIFLLVGMVVARPYCRFFCPYGVLLGVFSYFSKNHLKITPSECIQCRLCEKACPVDAIEFPTPGFEKSHKESQLKRLGVFLLLTPIFVFITGFSCSQLQNLLAKVNPTIWLAEQIHREEAGNLKTTTLETDAFRGRRESREALQKKVEELREKFNVGSWLLGIFLGIVFSIKIIFRTLGRTRPDYEPDRFNCISCGRCMEYCPVKVEK